MARYCTNCYSPAKGGESFCRNCGQLLKTEEKSEKANTVEEKQPGFLEADVQKEAPKTESIVSETVKNETNQGIAEVVTFGEWVWSTLLCFIPLVNIIMLIIWAATSETNPNKQNFAKAMLIWTIAGIVFSIIFFTMFLALAMVSIGGYGGGYGYGFTF